jgi:cyclophilin family peptidyl-prolyl cis-trans isomerase/HEAT repeat protein
MRCGTLIFCISVFSYACTEQRKAPNKFANETFVRIADLQDRRSGDSLIFYLKDQDPQHREAAALAFASIQDSSYIPSLKTLLKDNDIHVRKAVAYAIGQTPGLQSAEALRRACSEEVNGDVLAAIVEGYGKVARRWDIALPSNDSTVIAPTAWAYYRLAVRGLSDQNLNAKAAALLQASDPNARLAAAHYFARGAKDFDSFTSDLIDVAKHDALPEVRMAAVLALRKVKSESTRYALTDIYKLEEDYRIRVNAVRAFQDFDFADTQEILVQALRDSVPNVGIAASEVIKASATKTHWLKLSAVAKQTKHWRIQANLYEAALGDSDHKELAEEIMATYRQSSNAYQRAALLGALQHAIMSYGFVRDELMKANELVIKVAAASALAGMNRKENFPPTLRSIFAKIYEDAIASGDAAVTGIIADALADSTLNYKSEITDYHFLHAARNKLSLPKDFESIVPLEAAIAYFEGKKPPSFTNDFNHPIDWNLVKQIPSQQKAIIRTSKGDITIRLFVEEAPGSVANFVSLAMRKYYHGKFFHRVVPNFVVQGGCPRGDGYGSEAYSIRSEFYPHLYQTGSVGMASAGKDTEGTQWFITHSPTPHLEGRYTRFAMVEDGMNVVDKIEVGDRILSIDIIGLEVH